MAGKKTKMYFVNPASAGADVWAAPSKGHEKGKYILDECDQTALKFLYEEVGNTTDIYCSEMTAAQVKRLAKGREKTEEERASRKKPTAKKA